ncbi:MAG: hypothetical protein ABI591_23160 [Kofleriaceae bacterium]
MSETECARIAGAGANSASPHARSVLARALHHRARVWTVIASALLVGCIIPPSLSVDVQDAGIDSPPSITSVRSDLLELVEPGPYQFPTAPNAQNSTVNLTLLDTDVDDALFVRIFVNYTVSAPTAPRSTCSAVATGVAVRTTTCSLAALCLPTDPTDNPLMEIVVFDREPLDVGTPTFKAIPAGGQSTTRTYTLICTNEHT